MKLFLPKVWQHDGLTFDASLSLSFVHGTVATYEVAAISHDGFEQLVKMKEELAALMDEGRPGVMSWVVSSPERTSAQGGVG